MSLSKWFANLALQWRRRSHQVSYGSTSTVESPVTWLWTCSGEFFGYRIEDSLFTYAGRQAGQFGEGDEIYDAKGEYIGEVRLLNRLITNLSKRTWRRRPFLSRAGTRFKRSGDLASVPIAPGFEDFPSSSLIV